MISVALAEKQGATLRAEIDSLKIAADTVSNERDAAQADAETSRSQIETPTDGRAELRAELDSLWASIADERRELRVGKEALQKGQALLFTQRSAFEVAQEPAREAIVHYRTSNVHLTMSLPSANERQARRPS
jgi:chromosome segregation ATPase